MTTSLARNLASQSVHLTIHPPPRSLSESKLVLSALQKYGEVVTFKNLKYDKTNTNPTAPRNTIAVFESPQAAKAAIAGSPLRIALPSSHTSSSLSTSSSSTSTTTSSSSSPSSSTSSTSPTISSTSTSSSSSSSSTTPNPSTRPPPPPPTSPRAHPPKTLFCNLQPSRHNHLSSLHRNPCYGSFKPDKESHQAVDLRRTGIPVKELADVPVRWKLGSSQSESRGRGRGRERERGQGQGQGRGQEQEQIQAQGQGGDGATDTGVGVFAWSKRKRCRMGGTSLQALFNTKVEDGEGGKIEAEEGRGKRE